MGRSIESTTHPTQPNTTRTHKQETVTLPDGKVLKKGDVVTIDGSTGEMMLGAVPLVRSTSDADFQQVRSEFWLFWFVGIDRWWW